MREDLIRAGLTILAEEGLDRLTLRKVAARVGVSHAAPAHHFKGLPDLLGHICAHGFNGLTRAMQDRQSAASKDARAQLGAICEGYVDFATDNPGLMQLMFSDQRQQVDDTALQDAADEAYGVLKAACAPFRPVGEAPDSTETLIWSLVHGLAFLRLGGRFANPNRVTAWPEVADILPELELRQNGA